MGPVRSGLVRVCQTRLIPRSPDGDNKYQKDVITSKAPQCITNEILLFQPQEIIGPQSAKQNRGSYLSSVCSNISRSVLPFFLRETPETGILTFSPRFNDPDFVLVQHPLAASRHTEIFTHLFPVGNKSPQLPPSFSPVNKNPPQPTLSSSPNHM